MSIVLTGANGQVGSEIQKFASKYGVPVVAYSRSECNIANYSDTKKLIETTSPELIINTAAYTAVDAAEENTEEAFEINQTGCENLARIGLQYDIPLIHISTDYVFNGIVDAPYKETDTPSPESVYGKSKLAGENAIAKNCRKYIILRTSWVFGEYGNNFVKTILRLAKDKKEISVVNDQTGCPTSTQSLAEAVLEIVSAIRQGKNNWGIYHFCGKPETTWYGFACTILEQAAALGQLVPIVVPIKSNQYLHKAKRPKYSVLDCKKIRTIFSIEQPDWKKDLKELIKILCF